MTIFIKKKSIPLFTGVIPTKLFSKIYIHKQYLLTSSFCSWRLGTVDVVTCCCCTGACTAPTRCCFCCCCGAMAHCSLNRSIRSCSGSGNDISAVGGLLNWMGNKDQIWQKKNHNAHFWGQDHFMRPVLHLTRSLRNLVADFQKFLEDL